MEDVRKGRKTVQTKKEPTGQNLKISNLEKCTQYIFAVAVNFKSTEKALYVEKTFETGGNVHPPSSFSVTVHVDSIVWPETSGACAQHYAQSLIARRVSRLYGCRKFLHYKSILLIVESTYDVSQPAKLEKKHCGGVYF